jgi:hypothetical protein
VADRKEPGEAAREFTWLGQTAETRAQQERLRQGKTII